MAKYTKKFGRKRKKETNRSRRKGTNRRRNKKSRVARGVGLPKRKTNISRKTELADKILKKAIDRSGTCPLCFENLSRQLRTIELPCKHNFHKKCIDPWLKNKTCPMCRAEFTHYKNCRNIYNKTRKKNTKQCVRKDIFPEDESDDGSVGIPVYNSDDDYSDSDSMQDSPAQSIRAPPFARRRRGIYSDWMQAQDYQREQVQAAAELRAAEERERIRQEQADWSPEHEYRDLV